jgi:hypothetical protein
MPKEFFFIILSLFIFFRSAQPAKADLTGLILLTAGIGIGLLADKFNPQDEVEKQPQP